jgi:hypothetical protein
MSIKSSLIAALLILSAPAILLNSGSQASAASPGEPTPSQSGTGINRAYFLHIEGRALPLKQALVNGVNVLGGAVVSLSLPVNISGYTKPGLNTVQIDYISDPKSNLVVAVEKRTPGPKTEALAKITAAAGDSQGKPKSASVSFNLPDDGDIASVGELKDMDRAAIAEEFTRFYRALASAKADQVRALYRQSLIDERKLCPESARFFENVLNREVAILKNKDLKLNPLNCDGLAFKVEGDSVKLYRKDSKPLIESNEVDAQIAPLLIEVGAERDANGKPLAQSLPAGKKPASKRSRKKDKKDIEPKAALTASTTEADEPDAEKAIEIPVSAFLPVSQASDSSSDGKNEKTPLAAPGALTEVAREIAIVQPAEAPPLQVRASDGTIAATEIKVGKERTVFDGSKPADPVDSAAKTASDDRRPPKTAVRERLVRFNLYFKPSRPDSSGRRVWVVSLPPNT